MVISLGAKEAPTTYQLSMALPDDITEAVGVICAEELIRIKNFNVGN